MCSQTQRLQWRRTKAWGGATLGPMDPVATALSLTMSEMAWRQCRSRCWGARACRRPEPALEKGRPSVCVPRGSAAAGPTAPGQIRSPRWPWPGRCSQRRPQPTRAQCTAFSGALLAHLQSPRRRAPHGTSSPRVTQGFGARYAHRTEEPEGLGGRQGQGCGFSIRILGIGGPTAHAGGGRGHRGRLRTPPPSPSPSWDGHPCASATRLGPQSPAYRRAAATAGPGPERSCRRRRRREALTSQVADFALRP
ncbi:hypothetical protein NN561_006835 [Cricetulus griseus]